MHPGQSHGHERIAERADTDAPRLDLALASRDAQAARGASEGHDPLPSLALVARPQEDPRGAKVESPERSELHLDGPLDAAPPDDLRALGLPFHGPIVVPVRLRSVPRRLALLLAAVVALVVAPGAAALDQPPRVEAASYLVANAATGEVILRRDADERRAPASITKLMTALVTLEHARPGDMVKVRPHALTVGESSVDLRVGERLSVRDLLAASLIQSANNAAFALAQHVGDGDVGRFVRLMNEKARELGLSETRFVRPDGLDVQGHVSSATDVLVLARAAMQRPLIRELVRKRSATIAGGRSLYGWNDLLGRFDGLVGVKTGHTARAGWCQVGLARRGGVGIYAVVLGSPTRAQRNRDLARLLRWGFEQYVRVDAVDPKRTYATAAVPFSDERLDLVPASPAQVVTLDGRALLEEVVAPAIVALPVRRGQELGEIRVLEGRRIVARRPLVAARAAGEPSLGARVGWYAERSLEEAAGMVTGVFGALS